MDLDHIRELYEYTRWANQRTLSAAAKLDLEKFTRAMGNSFASVRDTLSHILSGEWIWLERWQGRFPADLLNPTDFPTVQSLETRWKAIDQDREQFMMGLTRQRLNQDLAYLNRAGLRFSYPLWQQMIHVVNHSTYHRGQVTTMLRQLGAEPAVTDFLVYYDEKATR